MNKNTRFLKILLSFGLIMAVCACRKGPDSKAAGSSLTQAPDFSLKSLAGTTARLSDYRGKIVILDFWATWCPPCRKEIPDFVQLQKDYGARGVQMLGISLDRGKKTVLKPFAEKYKINYPILIGDGRVDQAYGGITGIPTTFIIDRQGRIVKKYVGYRPKSVFEAAIKNLLE